MRTKFIILFLFLTANGWCGSPTAEERYAALEHHLQSLNSLELRYLVSAPDSSVLMGHLIFCKPGRFLHDTPEWTLCERKSETWRHIKPQHLLIWEKAPEQGGWRPEMVLFNLKKEFRAGKLDHLEDGSEALQLLSVNPDLQGKATLFFLKDKSLPDVLEFSLPETPVIHYQIVKWEENISVDTMAFEPPQVPKENILDFRILEEKK